MRVPDLNPHSVSNLRTKGSCERMRISTDLWLTFVVFGLSALAAILTNNLSAGGLGTGVGPAFFPWLMVFGMLFFTILLLIRTLWERQAAAQDNPGINWKLLGKLALFLIYMTLYAAFYVKVGYLISTSAFFILSMLTLGERRPIRFLVVPLCITGGVYLVFTKLLDVYIP